MAVFQIEPESVCQELVSAFGKASSTVAPTISEDEAPYGYEWRFRYLSEKSWQEVAADERFLAGHIEDELYFMSGTSFLYFLPGFLIGTLVHRGTGYLVRSLAGILRNGGSWSFVEPVRLSDTLEPSQKRAVIHWLMVQINRAEEEEGDDYSGKKSSLWAALKTCRTNWEEETGEE